jgi:YVTN family beta-propeller protein
MSCLQNNASTVANAAAQNEGIMAKIKSAMGCVLKNINECFGTREVLRGYVAGDADQRIGGVWAKDIIRAEEPPPSGSQGDVETARKREQDYPETVMKNRDGVPFAGISSHGMVKSPDGQSVYLLDPVKREICKIDPTTNECVATIPLDGRSSSSIVNGCRSIAAYLKEAISGCFACWHYLLSCCYKYKYADACLGVADTIAEPKLAADEWHPDWLKITPDGSKFLVTYHHQTDYCINKCVSIIDRETEKMTPKLILPVPGEPLEIAIAIDSKEAYLTMPDGYIVVIDLKKGEVKEYKNRRYIEAGSDLQKVVVDANEGVYSLHATAVKAINHHVWEMRTILEGVFPESVAFHVLHDFGINKNIGLFFVDPQDGSIRMSNTFGNRTGRLVDGDGNPIIVGKRSQAMNVGADGSWIATFDKETGRGNWIRVVDEKKAKKEAREKAREKATEDAKEKKGKEKKGTKEATKEEEEQKQALLGWQSSHKIYWNVNELSAYLYYHWEIAPSHEVSQTQPVSLTLPNPVVIKQQAKMIYDRHSVLIVDPERRHFVYSDHNRTIYKENLPFCPHYMLTVPVDLNRQNSRLNTVALLMSMLCIGMAFVLNSFINPRMFSLYQMRLTGMTLYLGTMSVIACLIMVITQKAFWKIVVIVLSVIACLVAFAAVFVILMLASGYPQVVWEQMFWFLVGVLLVLLFLTWLAKKCEARGCKGFLSLLSALLLLVVVTMAIAFFILLFISTDHTVLMTNLQRDRVLVYDTKTKNVTTTISTGEGLSWLAVTPDKTTAYATNQGSGTVSVIDMATYQVRENITVGGEPTYVALSPDGGTALVSISNGTNGMVSAIDLSTNQVVANISVAMSPGKIV